jgi:hypothetical protein
MLRRLIVLAGTCLSIATTTAPAGLADPPADPAVTPADATNAPANPTVLPASDAAQGSPPASGPVPSGNPGTLTTPEGLVLTVSAAKESLDPVTALTNTPWSREYIVGGVVSGKVSGPGHGSVAGGMLEAGYQIGCGITQTDLHAISTAGITPGIGVPFVDGELLPVFLSANASEQLRLVLEPGRVNTVTVTKKEFDGDWARVAITGMRIWVDGCSGQSFIRSFATFSSSTDDNADVVTYYGVTRAV